MTWSPDTHELDELLGAYALDAVDADEVLRIESYLRESPRARAEVEEYREVAALMASTGTAAPEGLWERIATSIETPPDTASAPVLEFRRPPRHLDGTTRRWVRTHPGDGRRALITWKTAGIAASIVAAVAIGFAVTEIRLDDRVGEISASQELAEEAIAAMLDPDARQLALAGPDGAVAMRIVVRAEGHGYVVSDDLPRLADGTYQLWRIPPADGGGNGDGSSGSEPISLDVLGASPGISEFEVTDPAGTYAVTIEPPGGSDQPTTDPIALS